MLSDPMLDHDLLTLRRNFFADFHIREFRAIRGEKYGLVELALLLALPHSPRNC
jgi:hypothetical protein